MLSMDQNYYEYFIKYGEDPEFSNLLIGSGGSGGGFGLDGGIGFFGSIINWLSIYSMILSSIRY